MKKVTTYKGAVMTWECDSNRHMNVMYYINKFEHAGRNFDLELNAFKTGGDSLISVVVLEQQIRYLREVFEDDLLYVETSLLDIRDKAFTIYHEMYNARSRQLVSTMKAVLVFFDKEERKAISFPADRRAALLKEISDG